MPLIRWLPFRDVEETEERTRWPEGRERVWRPLVDVEEDKERILVKLELPGVNQEDVKISVSDNVMTLTGERKPDMERKECYHCRERFFGTFSRSFSLPSTVDTQKIMAEMQQGVLRVTLPKKPESKPRQIEIKSA